MWQTFGLRQGALPRPGLLRRQRLGEGEADPSRELGVRPHCRGRRLDALIVRTIPGVRKAVRWNSPF